MAAGSRREARERALSILYEAEIRGIDPVAALDAQLVAPEAFVGQLVRAASEQRERADELIAAFAERWPLGRMPIIDRSLLRLAIAELVTGTAPPAAILSEAVALAKQYSTEDSGRFVNGLLAAVARSLGLTD